MYSALLARRRSPRATPKKLRSSRGWRPSCRFRFPLSQWRLPAEAESVLPYGAVGYPKLPGEQPRICASFTVAQRCQLVCDLARFLVTLHRVDTAGAMAHDVERPEAAGLATFFRGVRDDALLALRNRVEPPFFALVEQW